MKSFASLLLLSTLSAYAAAPARYGDPIPEARPTALEARVAGSLEKIARDGRREVPTIDVRLTQAARTIAAHLPADGRPSSDLIESALRLNGIIEPPPHIVVARMERGGDEELLTELRGQFPQALTQGHYRRAGVGIADTHCTGQPCHDQAIVILLLESFVELEPIVRALPYGGPAQLRGRLQPPYQHLELFVTPPSGTVTKIKPTMSGDRFEATFRCSPDKGRHQLELTAEGRTGPTVLANFPIYCGVAAPTTIDDHSEAPEPHVTDASSAEKALLSLLNADRQRASLPPLELDAKLAEVARGHSADMLAHGFVGHVSPSTGSAADRTRRAAPASKRCWCSRTSHAPTRPRKPSAA
jgi:hypothetical protein